MFARWSLLLLFALLPTLGCDATPPPPLEAEIAPTLAFLQKHLFTPACAGCHSRAGLAGGFSMETADDTYAALVDIPADNAIASVNGWVRIVPGDPDRSFLVRKMEQPGLGEGAPMPVGPFGLAEPWMNGIRQWIEEGAQR